MLGADTQTHARARRMFVACLALALVSACSACRREERRVEGPAYAAGESAPEGADGSPPMPAPGTKGPYTGNAWAMSEGQRLYKQLNCVGCHAHGGGGMGPPLMDGKWIYGFDDAAIFTSIVSGRPNGMPSFRHRLGDDQVWQLVTYVKSLGGSASKLAEPSRDDHMSLRPGAVRTDPQQPRVEAP